MASLGESLAHMLDQAALRKAEQKDVKASKKTGAADGKQKGQHNLGTEVTDEPQGPPEAIFYDPFAVIEQLGYKDRPSTMTYDTLRAIVWKVPLIQGIIMTRINQIANFCVPQPDRFQVGFTIRLADKDAKPTAADRKEIDRLTDWVLTTGYTQNALGRESFESFMRKIVRDALTFDQWCHPAGVSIATAQGPTPIEDIRVGDRVWTHEGRLRRVSELKRRPYTGEMIRLRWRGQALEATAEHPILVCNHPHARNPFYADHLESYMEWVDARDVKEGHYVVQPRAKLGDEEINTPFGPLDETLGRVLGLYVADGHLSAGNTMVITLGAHEEAYVEALEAWAEATGLSYRTTPEARSAAVYFRAYVGKEKGAWLKEICGARASEKRVPRMILEGPRRAREAFLAGYLEGDGCIAPTGARFNSTSFELGQDIALIASELGIPVCLNPQDYTDRGWAPQVYGSLSGPEYREWARRNGIPVADPKRSKRSALVTENYILYHVTAVERWDVEDLEVFNFEVEEDHSFQANGIVSHNCVEKVLDRKGRPAAFYAVDGATIRRADTAQLHPIEDPEQPQYVQVYDNQIVGEWSMQDMIFGIRNPTTDIRNYNYGVSEQEMLVNTITAMLWAFEYNSRFFSQGSTPKGLLNIKGPVNKRFLNSFRHQWIQMVSGVENAWRSPILNQEDVSWVDMHANNRDMEFSAFFDFLIKTITAVYGVDPLEVNFKYGDTGSKAMFESANQSKLVESKDKGLKPLLRHFARHLTNHLIRPINPDMEFAFVGLEAQTHEELAKLFEMRSKTTHTVNELRRELDMDDLPPEEGDVLLNPVWAQLKSQAQQAEMMQQQDGGEDPFGGEDDEDFGPDGFKNAAFGGEDDEDEGDGKGQSDEDAKKKEKQNPFGKSLRDNPLFWVSI